MVDKKEIEAILRVNHAGELGARQIYRAQRKILGDDVDLVLMASQEEKHLKIFTQLMIENRMRPTIFQPIWHLLSYGMGAVGALKGKRTAHACTIAVEDVIVDHYQSQINQIAESKDHQGLKTILEQVMSEENHHKEVAENAGGRNIKDYHIVERIVKAITKSAIKISEKI